jgi:hypothetical protein
MARSHVPAVRAVRQVVAVVGKRDLEVRVDLSFHEILSSLFC